MKILLPYLFICLYSFIMIKPLLPYIIDNLDHILNFQEHMATVHAHHGDHHVHTEVAKTAKNDNNEKSTNTLKKDASEKEYIIVDKDCVLCFQIEPRKYFTALPKFIVSSYLNNDYPPPRV